jgi:hypothetical protein
MMSKTDEGKFLWKAMAPILNGSILFAPMNDEMTNLIINEVKQQQLTKYHHCI